MYPVFVFVAIAIAAASVRAEDPGAECPRPVETDEPDAARSLAKEWFSKGVDYAASESYALARRAFRCSYRFVAHPASLLNAARAATLDGAPVAAEAIYREFVSTFPSDPKVASVEKELARLQPRSRPDEDKGNGTVVSPTGGETAGPSLRTDTEGRIGAHHESKPDDPSEPRDWTIFYEAARHEAAAGRTASAIELFTRYLQQGAGELSPAQQAEVAHEIQQLEQRVEVEAASNATESAVSSSPDRQLEIAIETIRVQPARKMERALPVAMWTSLGAGAAAWVGASVTGGLALSRNRYLETHCVGGCNDRDYQKKIQMEKWGTATNVLIGVGAAAVAAGISMILLSRRKRERRSTAESHVSSTMPRLTVLGIEGAF